MHDYTRRDMLHCLETIGLRPGATVLFHVGLGMLGRPEGVASLHEMNRLFLECCSEILGPAGTILIPTYSYSACRGERFDPRQTPSAVGDFSEFFRVQPGVIRSQEPILAVCGKGPGAQALFMDLPPTSYGPGCLYARMIEAGALLCTVGLRMHWATFRHHLEELAGVPFRYRKYFRSEILRENGVPEEVLWTYSVRLWSERANPDGRRLAEMMVRDNVCASAPLGRSAAYCVPADAYARYAWEKLREDPWLTAEGPAGDPLEIERQRVPPQAIAFPSAPGSSLEELARALAPLPRHPVSDAFDTSLDTLAENYPLAVQRFPTGTVCAGYLVPERWTCTEARLVSDIGEEVLNAAHSPLAVLHRSFSVDSVVPRAELDAHLRVHPTDELAVPAVSNPFRRDWGFCLSRRQHGQLQAQSYRALIQAQFSYGEMRIGQDVLPGSTDEELLLCGLLGCPCQFNSGLSGVLAGLEIMRALRALGRPLRRTVRLLVLPDATGFYAWAMRAVEQDAKVRLGLHLDMLATAGVPLSHSAMTAGEDLATSLIDRAGLDLRRLLAQATEEAGDRNPVPPALPLLALHRVLPAGHPEHQYPGIGTDRDIVTDDGLRAVREAAQPLLELVMFLAA